MVRWIAWLSFAALELVLALVVFAHPLAGDEPEFLSRGARIFHGGLADGYRPPVYPLFIALLGGNITRIRVAQALLAATLPMMAWRALTRATASVRLLGTIGVMVWLPLHYYVGSLQAETLAIVLTTALFCLLLEPFAFRPLAWAAVVGAVIGTAALTKANLVLLLPATVAYLVACREHVPAYSTLRGVGVIVACAGLVVLPWTLYISERAGGFVPLSTSSGANLLVGTACDDLGMGAATEDSARSSLPDRVATALELRCSKDDRSRIATFASAPRHVSNHEYFRVAFQQWRQRPIALSAYACAKVLHVMGLSLRNLRDWALAGFSLGCLLASAYLWRDRRHAPVVRWYASCFCVAAITAAVFLPNQRFSLPLLGVPGVILCAVAACELHGSVSARLHGKKAI